MNLYRCQIESLQKQGRYKLVWLHAPTAEACRIILRDNGYMDWNIVQTTLLPKPGIVVSSDYYPDEEHKVIPLRRG